MTRKTLTVNWNARELRDLLDGMAREDVSAAAFVAVRRTSLAARNEVVAKLDDAFTVRRLPFIRRGIRVKLGGSPTSALSSIFGQIGTIDEFLAQHDAEGDGEERQPGKAGYRAQPIEARQSPTDVLAPKVWPGRLVKQRKARKITGKDGSTYVVGTLDGAGPQRLLYKLTRTPTPIPPRWPMVEQINDVAARGLMPRLVGELDKRISARSKAAGRRRPR
jgi:hypothetical protein